MVTCQATVEICDGNCVGDLTWAFVWVAVSDVGKTRQSTVEERNYILRYQHDFSFALASLSLERHS